MAKPLTPAEKFSDELGKLISRQKDLSYIEIVGVLTMASIGLTQIVSAKRPAA